MKIGLVVPLAEEDGRQPRYAEIRALARQVEAGGLDSVWVFDHLLFRFDGETTGIWEAWTVLSALAEVTERVELGTLVMCTAFRNPALMAKMADTLDEVSGGRLILGLGAGWHEPEFDAFGIPFDHLVSRFEESLTIICDLLRTGRADLDGRYVRARDCVLVPRGPRAGGPPILIAGKKPRMLSLVARQADAWNVAWLGSRPTLLQERQADLRAALQEAGRDEREVEVNAGLEIRFGDAGDADPDRVLTGSVEEVAEALARYAALGVGHAVCALTPTDERSVAQLVEAARRSRTRV